MKRFFMAVSFCLFFTTMYAKEEVDYHELIEKEGESYYQEELFTGKAIDGRNRFYFQNGKATGTWLFFYKNGNIKSIESWKEGKLDGKYILYLEDGTKSMQTFYKQGKDNGNYRLYYPNGSLRVVGQYENGKPKGTWYYYNENGKLKGKAKENL